MKLLFGMALALLSTVAYGHDHHVKHNMVLVGESEIFASHLVYKSPHNFQVILRVGFGEETRARYLAARKTYPDHLLILLLNPTDISKIASTTEITGTLLREDPSGVRTELEANIKLEKKDFQLLYFDEVPLSLAPNAP